MPSVWRTHAELDNSSESQNTDILGSDVTPNEDGATLRISGAFDTAGVWKLHIKPANGTNQVVDLNNGDSVPAGAYREFDVTIGADADINIQHGGTSPTAHYLAVQELVGGGV